MEFFRKAFLRLKERMNGQPKKNDNVQPGKQPEPDTVRIPQTFARLALTIATIAGGAIFAVSVAHLITPETNDIVFVVIGVIFGFLVSLGGLRRHGSTRTFHRTH